MHFDKSKVIAIICARGGSKGLHRKNLRLLNGKPLICWPIEHCLQSNSIGTILVSTDDKEIADVAVKAGAIVPFLRPQELAQDLTTTEDTLSHALNSYERLIGFKFEIAVFLTATDIFRKASWITDAIDILISKPEIESVFSGHRTHKNFWEQKEDGSWIRLRNWMSRYSSRQIRKSIVREDTGLVCASRAWLWREGRRIGDKVEIIINDDDFTSIDIHHEEDLLLAEAALKLRENLKDK